jgi:hypothetical protein
MSSSSSALSPARIEDLREIPIDFPSGRLDSSTTAAFDGLVVSLFTRPNPPMILDVLEMWCFPRLLDICLDRGSAPHGGRL